MTLFRRSFPARGAAPGAVAPPLRRVTPRVFALVYDDETIREWTCESVDDLPQPTPGKVMWIDVQGLGDGTVIQEYGARLGLHPLAISDVVNVGQRPKVDQYGDVSFVVLHMVTAQQDKRLQWEQVSVFLGTHFVLTFQETHVDCLEPLRERIRSGRRQIRTGGIDYLACMVIDAIVDGYFPVLEHYGDVLERLERHVLDNHKRNVLNELYLVKRDLATFRRAAWPLREALAHMLRDEQVDLAPVASLHLRDTLDHVLQVVEVTESYRELSASLVDVHLSMLGQRTNEIMRVLTVVSTIFIPLTFLAGVYGMNFDRDHALNMPELGWAWGYPVFWAICLVTAAALLVLFRRLGWLGGHRS